MIMYHTLQSYCGDVQVRAVFDPKTTERFSDYYASDDDEEDTYEDDPGRNNNPLHKLSTISEKLTPALVFHEGFGYDEAYDPASLKAFLRTKVTWLNGSRDTEGYDFRNVTQYRVPFLKP